MALLNNRYKNELKGEYMSVPIRNRSESEIDYHYDAVMVDQSLIQLALRNFGVKDKIRSVDFYTKINKLSKEDAEKFKDIIDRNNLGSKITEEYPQWIIDYFRNKLLETSNRMAYDVEMACTLEDYGITNYNEFLIRQKWQDMALGESQQVFRQLQRIMKTLPLDNNKLMPYVGEIINLQNEINNWRKKTNLEESKFKVT